MARYQTRIEPRGPYPESGRARVKIQLQPLSVAADAYVARVLGIVLNPRGWISHRSLHSDKAFEPPKRAADAAIFLGRVFLVVLEEASHSRGDVNCGPISNYIMPSKNG